MTALIIYHYSVLRKKLSILDQCHLVFMYYSRRFRDGSNKNADDKEPFVTFAFKIATDPFVPDLTFFSVNSSALYPLRI